MLRPLLTASTAAFTLQIVGFASGCLPSLLGFTLRFGTASEHPLDMAYGRNTVYVDILVSKGFASLPAVHQVGTYGQTMHLFV